MELLPSDGAGVDSAEGRDRRWLGFACDERGVYAVSALRDDALPGKVDLVMVGVGEGHDAGSEGQRRHGELGL